MTIRSTIKPRGRALIVLKRVIRRLMPRSIRSHRVIAGPLRGRRLVTSWHDYPAAILGYTERPLLRWLQRTVRPGETWIDVGAHYGYTALALSDLVGVKGRVFAFEPVVTTAGYLSKTRALNQLRQLTVVPFALGERRGLQAIDAPLVRGMADHVTEWKEKTADRIFVTAFDEVWPGIADRETRLDGVKIDVQGMEIEVLAGMREALLASHPVLVLELHRGVDRDALLRILCESGYSSKAEAIEPLGEVDGNQYVDNCSYCFRWESSPGA